MSVEERVEHAVVGCNVDEFLGDESVYAIAEADSRAARTLTASAGVSLCPANKASAQRQPTLLRLYTIQRSSQGSQVNPSHSSHPGPSSPSVSPQLLRSPTRRRSPPPAQHRVRQRRRKRWQGARRGGWKIDAACVRGR